jgi:hypothetical protein
MKKATRIIILSVSAITLFACLSINVSSNKSSVNPDVSLKHFTDDMAVMAEPREQSMSESSLKNPKSKPRVVISTDFPPLDVIPGGARLGPDHLRSDPDDIQSMIRFLLYANELKVEGLIATSATVANFACKQGILDLLYLYDRIDENLGRHDPAYPTANELRSVTWLGQSKSYARPAMEIIGPDKDSEASDAIISLVDDTSNPSPVWFLFWGGSRELAQAIWKVRETRGNSELEEFLAKIRVYLIALQDGTGQWLMEEFPNLFIIYSEANWRGMFYNAPDSDESLANLEWLNRNVRWGNGLLAAFYPEMAWFTEWRGVVEGDSPSFLHLVSGISGINNPEDPGQPGWGGQFIRAHPDRNQWIDHPDGQKTIWRWRADVQEDFARRAKWMRDPYPE